MRSLYKITQGLEAISLSLQSIPIFVYAIIFGSALLLCCIYYFWLPKCKLSDVYKSKFKVFLLWILIFVYIGSVLIITTFIREPSTEYGINLYFIKSIIDSPNTFRESISILYNMFLFVPIGSILYCCIGAKGRLRKTILCLFCFSLMIETFQLAFCLGCFDLNDLFFNVIGGLFGYGIRSLWRWILVRGGKLKAVFKILAITCCCIFILCIALFLTYHILRVRGVEVSRINISSIQNQMATKEEQEVSIPAEFMNDPNIIWYKGKPYKYNDSITTILGMGIDQKSEQIEEYSGVSGQSGQADAIFLIVLDSQRHEVELVNLSRDIMCAIKTFDFKGNYLGESMNHLGLVYCFGDGKHTSCQYVVDAVSNLLYGMPIHAYFALNMEGINKINDTIGGVTVVVPEDLTEADEDLVKGTTVTLKGKQASYFLAWRNTTISHSNNLRMERQKIYIRNFATQAMSAIKGDILLPVKLYNSLQNEMVTNISLEQMTHYATEALSLPLDEYEITTLKGEVREGTVYDEMYLDEDALYEFVINTFYVEVPVGEE